MFLPVYSLPFGGKCLILQAKVSFMIDKIRIRNYKSIVELTLDLGRFNVIIGTNGCGKSNILEAITMGALGVSDNADIGRLAKHGIRVTDSINHVTQPSLYHTKKSGTNGLISSLKNTESSNNII